MSKINSELAARNLKIIQDYHHAIRAVRQKYFDTAKSQEMNSIEQSQSIDQLLVLDFMIESNQRTLDYLNHFKQHYEPRSTQALEDILSKLTIHDDEDIHATIMRFKNDIILHSKNISETLKNTYNLIATIRVSRAVSLHVLLVVICLIEGLYVPIGTAMVSALGPVGLVLYLALFTAHMAIIVALMIHNGKAAFYAQPGHFFYQQDKPLPEGSKLKMRSSEVQIAPQPDPENSTSFTKLYENNYTTHTSHREGQSLIETTITTLFATRREQTVAVLRETFTNSLAHEVAVEYIHASNPIG